MVLDRESSTRVESRGMCRIWGIVYGPQGPEGEPLTPTQIGRIMFPSLVRGGPHAWGWMAWSGGEIEQFKRVGRSDTDQAIRSVNLPNDARWVIGHTRYATHGSPSRHINNHPIVHGNIIGVHNGVLTNHTSILDKTGRHDDASKVDSEAIFAAVNRWGEEDGLAKVDGSLVSIFVNKNDPALVNIARSHGRPLVMAWTKAGSLVFASEKQALERLGLVLTEYTSMLGEYRLLQVEQGIIFNRSTYREDPWVIPEPTPIRKGARTGWSASATRRAMMTAKNDDDQPKRRVTKRDVRKEIELAREFIAKERAKSQERIEQRKVGER